MDSNKYYTGIITRVILIALSSLLLAFLAYKTNYLYSITVLAVMVVLQTWGLIRYILRRRDDIKRMLEYIKENNPSIYFTQSRDYPFNELGYFLNEIEDIVREVRIEKENQLQYMNYIVGHIGTGLISFDREGRIDIMNKAARDLLGAGEIASIDLLEQVYKGLPGILRKLRVDEQKVITLKSENRLRQLAIRISVFRIREKEIRLASFQDIKNELDEKEMDSWQKLIRVLTHEIINSVTPVTSLTTTIAGFFRRGDRVAQPHELTDENIQEALTGLGYIEDRGKNLIGFVSKFRSLTKLPAPKFEEVNMTWLIHSIASLRKDELASRGISLKVSVPDDSISMYCDKSLIEHVLLNLVNNASDALSSGNGSHKGLIEITGGLREDQRPVIYVRDNGCGIPDELIGDIFIPFFTTKDNGSGIGLSLARQIMKLHGGTITVYSNPGTETVFSLLF